MIDKSKFSKKFYVVIILALSLLILLFFLNREKIYSLNKFSDLKPLIEKAAKHKFVLLGESSHGTSEYYQLRSLISQDLVSKHNFSLIVVEGDWDALYQLNLYVKHKIHPVGGAREILKSFDRWPNWMWANEEFLSFVEWLRSYNSYRLEQNMVGVYGKDIYGVKNSIEIVLDYFKKQSPELELIASDSYDCLRNFSFDFNEYLKKISAGHPDCRMEIAKVLELLVAEDFRDDKEYFNALQNAWVVVHAEEHYRNNLFNNHLSWNARVLGMKDIFTRVNQQYGKDAKAIIWAHNTHVGDARATEMKDFKMLNIGQILREEQGDDNVFIVGFGTYKGSVLAGLSWGSEAKILNVPIAQKDSLEDFLAKKSENNFFIFLDKNKKKSHFNKVFGHRAKGVVYNPINDNRQYVRTIPSQRYDAFIFFHETKALTPISN